MTRFVRVAATSAFIALFAAPAGAQTASSSTPDPRVGLNAGLRDAGIAARGLELLANVPKPQGFFDPRFPAGEPNPPVTDEDEAGTASTTPAKAPAAKSKPAKKPAKPKGPAWGGLNFA